MDRTRPTPASRCWPWSPVTSTPATSGCPTEITSDRGARRRHTPQAPLDVRERGLRVDNRKRPLFPAPAGSFGAGDHGTESETVGRCRQPSVRLRTGLAVAAATVGAGLLTNELPALTAEGSGGLTPRDAAILGFLAAAEILESLVRGEQPLRGGLPGRRGAVAAVGARAGLPAPVRKALQNSTLVV
jgi:hypothetical protein